MGIHLPIQVSGLRIVIAEKHQPRLCPAPVFLGSGSSRQRFTLAPRAQKIQFTVKSHEPAWANRDLGSVENVNWDNYAAQRLPLLLRALLHAVIVFIAHRLQPNCFSFLSWCNGDVGKATLRRCAVPMLHSRSAFDYVSLVNDARRLSSFLIVASPFGDQQNLTTRMTMPIQLCAGIIGCHCNTGIECAVSYVQLTEPDIPRVILGGG